MATTYPGKVQTFVTMKDVTAEDAPLVKQYQEAVESGDNELAQRILNNIPEHNAKLIRADFFNTMSDTCVALQNTFDTAFVPDYIVSESRPTQQKNGELWFEITGEV